MDNQGDAVIGKDVCWQTVPVNDALDMPPCLFRVPWSGMNKSMIGPVYPGVAPFVRELLLDPSHQLNCPKIRLNVEPFI